MHRQRGPRRRVGAAAGEDHLRALIERAQVRLGPHHADDALRAIDGGGVERRSGPERLDLPRGETALEIPLVLLGVDHREPEAQPVLARDVVQDLDATLQMRLSAGAAAGSDHHRDAIRDGAVQQEPHVAADGERRGERFPRAEIMRPGVRAAAVHADHVRLALEPRLQRSLGIAIAEYSARRNHPHFVGHGFYDKRHAWTSTA
jgi:hypothetical protein